MWIGSICHISKWYVWIVNERNEFNGGKPEFIVMLLYVKDFKTLSTYLTKSYIFKVCKNDVPVNVTR